MVNLINDVIVPISKGYRGSKKKSLKSPIGNRSLTDKMYRVYMDCRDSYDSEKADVLFELWKIGSNGRHSFDERQNLSTKYLKTADISDPILNAYVDQTTSLLQEAATKASERRKRRIENGLLISKLRIGEAIKVADEHCKESPRSKDLKIESKSPHFEYLPPQATVNTKVIPSPLEITLIPDVNDIPNPNRIFHQKDTLQDKIYKSAFSVAVIGATAYAIYVLNQIQHIWR